MGCGLLFTYRYIILKKGKKQVYMRILPAFAVIKQKLFVPLQGIIFDVHFDMNNIPAVTKNLLIINVLMFLATYVASTYGIDMDKYLALHFFLAEDFNLAQLFTYMFMHGGFTHLFFNMFALWMFGRILEQVWGPKRFLTFYLVCGLGAGLVQEVVQFVFYETTLVNYDAVRTAYDVIPMAEYLNRMSTVGASGAVYGILLGFGMLFPNERMFVFPLPFPIKAKLFVIGYALIELWSGMANNPNDNVAHFAHLGGMVFGFILITYWRRKNKRNGYYYN